MIVAVYGSLKKGFYNHRALGADARFLGKDKVRGVMYSNGSYPKLYKPLVIGTDGADMFRDELIRDHELEVYSIENHMHDYIHGMEIGAGYIEEDIKTEFGKAKIYYMPHDLFDPEDVWVKDYTHKSLERI